MWIYGERLRVMSMNAYDDDDDGVDDITKKEREEMNNHYHYYSFDKHSLSDDEDVGDISSISRYLHIPTIIRSVDQHEPSWHCMHPWYERM